MSPLELSEWVAYFNIEPNPTLRADISHAQLMALTHNAASAKGSARPPADFFQPWDKQQNTQSENHMRGLFKIMATVMGGPKNG